MSVRMQEVVAAFGFRKQTAIGTAAIAADCWRLSKINAALANPKLITESDAAEYGKGHEFATALIKSYWDVGFTIEKYLSAEMAAWALSFGMGKVVKTGSGGNWIYTITTPFGSAGDSVELPTFSWVEQIRIGGGTVVLDRVIVGVAVESWMISLGSGPGRANSKIAIECVGSGKYVSPSSITIPAASAEKLLPAASAAVTIIGVDYITAKDLISLEMGWKNNIRMDSGFYPGSGFQTSGDGSTGAIRGRMEYGDRVGTLRFVARYKYGSAELTKLLALTTGTAVVTLTYDANATVTVTWQQVGFAVAEIGETDGWVSVSVDCTPQYHSTNAVVSAVAKCNTDNICQAPT